MAKQGLLAILKNSHMELAGEIAAGRYPSYLLSHIGLSAEIENGIRKLIRDLRRDLPKKPVYDNTTLVNPPAESLGEFGGC